MWGRVLVGLVGLGAFGISGRVVEEVGVAFVDRVVGEVLVQVLRCPLHVANHTHSNASVSLLLYW